MMAGSGVAAAAPNLSGSWSVIDHCKAGWCSKNAYTGIWTIVQKRGSSKLTGYDNAGGKLTGSISGSKASWTISNAATGYSFSVHVTVAKNVRSFAGTF